MKKTYIKPILGVFHSQLMDILANSNEISGTSGYFNRDTMDDGDGSDAAAKGSYWDDDEW